MSKTNPEGSAGPGPDVADSETVLRDGLSAPGTSQPALPPVAADVADQHTVLKAPGDSNRALPAVDPQAEVATFYKPGDSKADLPRVAPSVLPVTSPSGIRSAAQSNSNLPMSSSASQQLEPVPGTSTPKQKAPSESSGNLGAASGSGSGSGSREYTKPNQQTGQPEAGMKLHHYEVIKLVGRGGMGSVYLGRDTRLGRRVAIKFLQSQSADLTKRFILEARTTAACSHENIVTIFEVDAWQGSPFMVFEYIGGQTLTKLMPEGKPLPAPRAVELMVPVVRALAYAHSQGIVHRDLKPDNVMVTEQGLVKVLDFGIAKVLQGEEESRKAAAEAVSRPRAPKFSMDDEEDDTKELTRQGAMMGTLAYMAPEQWGIGVAIDHRADLWSAGIMLFKMLAGKHPLDPLRGQQLMVVGMLNEPMPPLHKVAPDVPKELAAVVDRCLLKHKEKRWPDAVSLLRALEPFLPGRFTRELKIDESPYAGLASFQEDDADRFFGRNQDIAAMVLKVRDRPLVAVVGPSGAGKSSFVRAGVVPALKRSGEAWDSLVVRPGRDPLGSLAGIIAPLLGTSGSVVDDLSEQKKLVERLRSEPGFVGAVLRARARREKKSLLLFVDQFEELYTLVADPKERLAFTACLSSVADDVTSPIRVVLSIRSDFLDRVSEDQRFMAEMNQGMYFLTAPGREGLKEAITQPAELAGYRFETPDIAEDMLKHLASTQGALPLLQFCASRLWDNRDAATRQLTRAAYDAIGGIGGALASHADSVVSRLPPKQQPLAKALFMRLVTADRTRAIVSMEELKEVSRDVQDVQSLVDELVQARLLVVQIGSGVATVEIVHESLIHSWPQLKRWLEESGEDAAFLEQVRAAARQWQQKGEDDNLLWRGDLADEGARFKKRYKGNLTDLQGKFLTAVVAQEQRAVRVKRYITLGAVGFLSLLVAAAAVALVVINRANQEAQKQAVVALLAEADAKDNLQKAQEKEKERAAAQAEAEAAAAQLRVKQQELIDALKSAEDAAEDARAAQKRAVSNAAEALAAKKRSEEAKLRADLARREVSALLQKEQMRAQRLEDQLGSPVIDTLK